METKSKSKPSDSLMGAVGFMEADLEINRSGQLSDSQRAEFQTEQRFWSLAARILASGILALAIIILLTTPKTLILLIFLLPIVALIDYPRSRAKALRKDCEADAVVSTEGRIRLDIVENLWRGGDRGYRLYIQELTFEVGKRAFLAFKNGDPYVIYYAANIKKILSVEWLRD